MALQHCAVKYSSVQTVHATQVLAIHVQTLPPYRKLHVVCECTQFHMPMRGSRSIIISIIDIISNVHMSNIISMIISAALSTTLTSTTRDWVTRQGKASHGTEPHSTVYIYIYICIERYMYVCMHACMYVCMYVRTHARTHARTHVCMYVCIYVCN